MSGLRLENVTIQYGRGRIRRTAVKGVDLAIADGEAIGLVGESGCGKSSLARAIAGLQPLAAGAIRLDGRDIAALRRPGRPSPVQLIFQDSLAALDPRMTVGASIREAVEARGIRGARAGALVEHHLGQVGLDPARQHRRPAELSGGQRQRVAIARALAAAPRVIVADEITSALDVSVQAAVLNLLRELRRELGFTLVFISHNLAAVRFVSDRIAVMRGGVIVEAGGADDVLRAPAHPYTRALLDAVPRLRAPGGAGRPSDPSSEIA